MTPLADYRGQHLSNTEGLRDLQARQSLETLLTASLDARARSLPDATQRPPLLVKVAPDLNEGEMGDIAEVSLTTGIDGIIIGNTTLDRPETLQAEKGEEANSSKPLLTKSTECLAGFWRLTEGKVPLVGCGGVSSGPTPMRRSEPVPPCAALHGARFPRTRTIYELPRIGGFSEAMGSTMSPTRWRRITVSVHALPSGPGPVVLEYRLIADPDAFSRPLPFLSDNDRATVHLGNSLFRKSWRPAPSATTASDGLGPLYNARSCADCHFRDGRGRPPNTGERALSLLLRLAPADPIYGRQLQNNAVDGHQPEGQVRVRYVERTVMLSGGEVVRLRKPIFGVEGETYGPLAPATQLDPRLAPPSSLGLLEAISEQDILAGADPQDRDGDGISGRSATVDGAVGRFGWKAGQLSIANQNAKALFLDIGIGNRRHPALWGDCTTAQTECQAGPHGDSPRHDGLEVSDKVLGHLTFYLQGIARPFREIPMPPRSKRVRGSSPKSAAPPATVRIGAPVTPIRSPSCTSAIFNPTRISCCTIWATL